MRNNLETILAELHGVRKEHFIISENCSAVFPLELNTGEEIPLRPSLSKARRDKVEVFRDAMWDIVMYAEDREYPVGYAVLQKKHGSPLYTLENDPHLAFVHSGMENVWGVEVHPDYRRRGIGSSLLSLAIGIALMDFKKPEPFPKYPPRPPSPFVVSARNEKKPGSVDPAGFYERYGFENRLIGDAIYSKYTSTEVRPIEIKP